MASLHFESTYDDSKLRSGLRQSNREVSEWARNAAHSGETVEQMFKRVQQAATGYLSFQFAKSMITQIVSVRGEWQKYEAVLTNTLGSNKDAIESLDMIAQYGAKTNFQVNELTDSFVKLAGQGFKPTREEMAKLGDLAASKAKGFNQLTEAIIDAETFEFERLKEFGIRASKDGEKITFTFKGIKTTVDASAEAVRNYVLSLGELEGVKGSTEAISKTIVGLASNFQDALDQMFNSMGKSQEGLIAGSIKAATELVQNYEKVIDVLKVLVTTYGAYKAATIAVTVANASMHFADNIRLIAMFRKEMGLATAAQQAFNVSAKVNPYGLALAGITALVTAFVIFNKRSTEAAGIQGEFKAQLSEATGEAKKLFKAITDSKTGTDQHAKAIQTVNDKYKEYLPNLLTEKANLEEVKKAQDAVTEAMARSLAFNAQQDQLKGLKTSTEEATKTFYLSIDRASGNLTDAQKGQIKALVEQYKDQVKAEFEKTGKMSDTFSIDLYKIFNDVSGGSIGTQAAYNIKTAIIDLIEREKELDKQTAGLKTTYESYLDALGLTGKAGNSSKEALQTVQQQIASTTTAITEAENKLAAMRSPGSTSTTKDIEEQEKVLEGLRKQLATLTGVKEEIKDLSGQISDLYKRLETADEKDRQIIAARILELQKEKVLREQIAENAVKAVRNEVVPETIQPKKQNIFLGDVQTIKNATAEFDKLNKKIEETKKKAASMPGVVDPEKFKQFLSFTQEALYTIRAITDEYSEQLGLNEQQAQVLQDGLQAISGVADIASGNFIQGGAKIVSSFLKYVLPQQKTLAEHFEKVADNIEKAAKSIDLASDSLSTLGIDSSYRSLKALQAELQGVAEAAKDLNKELNTSERGNSYGHRRESYSTINRIMEERANLEEEIEKLSERLLRGDLSDDQRKSIEAVLDSYNSVLDQIDGMIADLIGTSVSDLNDSLVDAFFDGEDAAEAWGKKVNDIIANLTKKQLVAKFLTDPVNDAIDELVKDYADSNLSIDELNKFKEAMNAVYEDAAPAIEDAINSLKNAGLFSENDSSSPTASGLTRSVQSLTEDTGGELAGIWRKTSDDTRMIRDYTREGINHLVQIEANTYNTVIELQNAVNELKASNTRLEQIATNTKQQSSNRDLGA